MKAVNSIIFLSVFILIFLSSCSSEREDLEACADLIQGGPRKVADDRSERFMGKVQEHTARCRGGEKAAAFRNTPWVDWSNYWATGDESSKKEGAEARTSIGEHLKPNGRGVDGSLIDLEYQRMELIKFNLFDNYTYESYVKGLGGDPGSTLKQWAEMRLPNTHADFAKVGGDGVQLCSGELIRHRTLTGICNDIWNPKMGATGTLFSRNAAFESTFPDLQKTTLAINRHSDPENGQRLGLLKPDPQQISRELFTRQQTTPECNDGQGDGSAEADCDYLKAPFFNVLAAFWIQFMTHDWFSHMSEGRNKPGLVSVGCSSDAEASGCRPGDRREEILVAQDEPPNTFTHDGKQHLNRAYKTTENTVTAWWDASQIYGYDATSSKRVLRDKNDNAKLLQKDGYLPIFAECTPDCPIQSQWQGQEVAAFPDNWNIGLSFYHNVFVREHNLFVDEFRRLQKEHPDRDSGLRNPADPQAVISYASATDEEIFQVARLVVSAEIAKIHTIEWTTQLLYGEPLFLGMNSNWFGLFNTEESDVSQVLKRIFNQDENLPSRLSSWLASFFGDNDGGDKSNAIYSIFASGAGIFGLNNKREEGLLWWKRDAWNIGDPNDLNGGVNHFGSPFNFPEEFTTVYRLHPLLPDMIELRDHKKANAIDRKIPVINAARGKTTQAMRSEGIANWALSMGRQRLGQLHLQNHPAFLQNLDMPHLKSPSGKLDIAALDIIRDRERGVPRFNEFRRQIGLKSLSSFDDFIDQRLPVDAKARQHQQDMVRKLRELYGTHICDASKVITNAQKDEQGEMINDCLGKPNGSRVDNIEDVDVVVGWLAEYTRPHGFAISETQFHIFIINASRRLFSDRFFTSSFRPEIYSQLGYDWVMNNGTLENCPYQLSRNKDGSQVCNEPNKSNGHTVMVSPMKRILMRTIPELDQELRQVINVFDPWARDRGEYYSLDWKPRADAQSDPAFHNSSQLQ